MPRRPNVRRLERRGNVPGLAASMQVRDVVTGGGGRVDLAAPTREAAAYALGRLDDPEATLALVAGLDDDDDRVRLAALEGLSGRLTPEAVTALADAALRWAGPRTAALGGEARRALVELAETEGNDVARRAAGRYLDGVPGDDELGGALVAELLVHADAAACTAIVTDAVGRLDGDDLRIGARAGRVLTALPDEGTGPLIAALDGNPRSRAALVLGQLRDARATPALLELLTAKEPEIRATAAAALGMLQDPRSVQGLVQATADPEHAVRAAAIEALRQLGPAATIWGVAGVMQHLVESGPEADVQKLISDGGAEITADVVSSLPADAPAPAAEAETPAEPDVAPKPKAKAKRRRRRRSWR
ncbi:MAG: hypothetical protein QOI80_2590 [Solirubrobacteraceae bacterium]|nr:hypothetical protein [Solirubrobacteraceae bacterium]